VHVLQGSAECRIDGRVTGGAFALEELTLPPGTIVPPHRHPREDEACYVLSGCVRFTVERRTSSLAAGDCVFVPRDMQHSMTAAGAEDARVLMFVSPAPDEGRGYAELLTAFATGPEGSPDLAEAVWQIVNTRGVERPARR
jgi:quercetin dioxygenase-like cupin family protein